MLDALSKSFFHALARSKSIEHLAFRYGMAKPASFGRRFIAGETMDEAMEAARALQAQGFLLTLDQLGESVTTAAEANAATDGIVALVGRVVEAGVDRNVSVKLTQLGLDIDPALCTANLRRIFAAAKPHDVFVRVDIENTPYIQKTFDVFMTLWNEGFRNTGTALQSAVFRSEDDSTFMCQHGIRVRLVKGAYKEPPALAHQAKADVDTAYIRIMKRLMSEGVYPGLATHDPKIIEAAKAYAAEQKIPKDKFEFQMLYGIRRDLQAGLVRDGYRMRVYVPFGKQWFPYFMRRLGERPANVGFVLKGIFGER